MRQAAADELVAVQHGTGHSRSGFGTDLRQFFKALAGFVQTGFEADLLCFKFRFKIGPHRVHFLKSPVLMHLFFHQGGALLFTGTVHLFHIVHFPGHGLIFPGVGHLHHFAFALFDARAVVVDFAVDALFLFLQVGHLFEDTLALGVSRGETGFQVFEFLRGLLKLDFHGMDGVVHTLKGNKLADLFKVKTHNGPPEVG